MANEEQLALLKQGVEAWNTLRLTNTDVTLDLEEANLYGTDLEDDQRKTYFGTFINYSRTFDFR
jgi:hypothetical protein